MDMEERSILRGVRDLLKSDLTDNLGASGANALKLGIHSVINDLIDAEEPMNNTLAFRLQAENTLKEIEKILKGSVNNDNKALL